MQNSVRERIKSLLKSENISVNKLSNGNGTLQRKLQRQINEDTSITLDTFDIIKRTIPDLNLEWLMTGEGEMLKTVTPAAAEDDLYLVPLVPVSAAAGQTPDISQAIRRDQCRMIRVPEPNCDLAIQISGESMLPDYQSGDIIAVRKIDDPRFVPYSIPLLLDTNYGAILKCLEPVEDSDADYPELLCVSLNKTYKPYRIPADAIRSIYRPVCLLRQFSIL